jgi:hypothetical protein
MPPGASLSSRARAAVVAGAILLLVAACGGGSSFDPTGPCAADGRAAGAYPDLEKLVPRTLAGTPADSVDSGRNCTAGSLGTLADHGISELRFAGATWGSGPNGGTSIAVFDAPKLQADWVHEFYVAGANSARDAESVEESQPAVNGHPAYRVDALNGESYQTVIDWQDGNRVRVVLVASFIREVSTKAQHEARVQTALKAATGG